MEDTEKKKQAIWRKLEKKFNFRVHRDVKKAMETYIGYDTTDDEETALTDFEGLLEEMIPVAKLAAETSFFHSTKKLKNEERRKRYPRPFNKRLHLVEFIISKQNFVNSNLITPPRINWKLTCATWNEMHPYDQMTKEVLKATYFRAIADTDIQRAFFTKRVDEILSTLTSIEHQLLRVILDLDDTQSWDDALKELSISNKKALGLVSRAMRKLRHPSRSKTLQSLTQAGTPFMKHASSNNTINNIRQFVNTWIKTTDIKETK